MFPKMLKELKGKDEPKGGAIGVTTIEVKPLKGKDLKEMEPRLKAKSDLLKEVIMMAKKAMGEGLDKPAPMDAEHEMQEAKAEEDCDAMEMAEGEDSDSSEESPDELKKQVAELKAKLAKLEGRSSDEEMA
jgi:polyhydroxyalkanoate synthesis regulator phasin